MKVSKRSELMLACENKDWEVIVETGWKEIYDALDDWFGGTREFPLLDLIPYVDLLGDEDPKTIMDALRTQTEVSPFRPRPAHLVMTIRKGAPQPKVQQQGRGPVSARLDNSPHAYENVRRLIATGHRVCECVPREPNLIISESTGVITCPKCDGIEAGQVDQATEAVEF